MSMSVEDRAAVATDVVGSDYVIAKTTRRKRRRTMAWALFGLVGLLIGAVWAAGLATSTSTADSTANSADAVFGSPTEPLDSRFTTAIAAGPTPLAIGFSGSWGTTNLAKMFEINLTGQEAGDYFASVYLDSPPVGFERIQVAFKIETATCAAATFVGGTTATSVMPMESADARAVFTGLAAEQTYCIGVLATTRASDTAGTFIRRPSGSSAVTAPTFIAGINQNA